MSTLERTRRACVRCDDEAAVDELGYCGPCHWISFLEVELGLDQLADYLVKWAQFADWCDAQGRR
jgi:hypothetical protein